MQDTLSEKTYRMLRHKVLMGELPAGSQLVNRTLAENLEVSLAPVREAIQRLATEGLVEYIPGAGAFVRKANDADLEELYILREAVESCAAAEAARYITEHQLAVLDEICAELEVILAKIQRQKARIATETMLHQWLDCEQRFHSIIVEAARNRLLAKVIDDYTAIGRVFGVQRHRAAILTLVVAEKTCREHAEIVAALHRRDAVAVQELMRTHIRNGRKTVMESLRKQRASNP